MQTGYVARPDCLRTFGLLGAVGSASTVHFGCPVPVFVAVQPGGGAPVARLSKFVVSASDELARIVVNKITAVLIGSLLCQNVKRICSSSRRLLALSEKIPLPEPAG